MGQINTEILARLAAPRHLRPLKEQELIDLYKRLHSEYAQFKAPEVEVEGDEGLPRIDLNSIETLRATMDAASRILTEAQKTRDEANRRPQVTQKRLLRDEHGVLTGTVEETL